MTITIGNAATDRASSTDFENNTLVDYNTLASGTGTLAKFEIFLGSSDSITSAKIGTFEVVSTGAGNVTLKSRDYAAVGSISTGSKQTFSGLNCAVVTNDCIGFYAGNVEGNIEATIYGSGVIRLWKSSGDSFTGSNIVFSMYSYFEISLYGESGPDGWTGKIMGVTNPAKIMGIDVANIAKVGGIE